VHGFARLLTLDRMVRDPVFARNYQTFQFALNRLITGCCCTATDSIGRAPALGPTLSISATTGYYMDPEEEIQTASERTRSRHSSTRIAAKLRARADLTALDIMRRTSRSSPAAGTRQALHASRFQHRFPVPDSARMQDWLEPALRFSDETLTMPVNEIERLLNQTAIDQRLRSFVDALDDWQLHAPVLALTRKKTLSFAALILPACMHDAVALAWWTESVIGRFDRATNNYCDLVLWRYLCTNERPTAQQRRNNRVRNTFARGLRADAFQSIFRDDEDEDENDGDEDDENEGDEDDENEGGDHEHDEHDHHHAHDDHDHEGDEDDDHDHAHEHEHEHEHAHDEHDHAHAHEHEHGHGHAHDEHDREGDEGDEDEGDEHGHAHDEHRHAHDEHDEHGHSALERSGEDEVDERAAMVQCTV